MDGLMQKILRGLVLFIFTWLIVACGKTITDSEYVAKAQDYLDKIQELCETPIDIISTGPDRKETIIRRHPYDS